MLYNDHRRHQPIPRWGRLLMGAAVVVLAVAGCESTTTRPSDTDATEAAALAMQGLQLLSQTMQTDTPDYGPARAKFEAALSKDPTQPEAHLGMAVVVIGELGEDPMILGLLDLFPAGLYRSLTPSSPVGLTRVFEDPVVHSGTPLLSTRGVLDHFYGGMLRAAEQGPGPIGLLQDVAQQVVLPAVTAATNHLNQVDSHAGWSLTLTPAMTGNSTSLILDRTDIYALNGVMHALKAMMHMFVAYNMDMPLVFETYEEYLAAHYAAFNQDNGTMMVLRAQGATNMASARTSLLTAAQKLLSFRTSLLAETGDQSNHLIKIDPTGEEGPTSEDLQDMLQALTEFSYALNNPIDLEDDFNGDGDLQTLRVNIQRLFTHPISDFKQAMPPYSWDGEYGMFFWDGYMEENFDLFLFPDPTMNGVFPELTTDALFKAFFGIDQFPDPGPFNDMGMGFQLN